MILKIPARFAPSTLAIKSKLVANKPLWLLELNILSKENSKISSKTPKEIPNVAAKIKA